MRPFPAGAAVENGIELIADRLIGAFGPTAAAMARRWAEESDLRYLKVAAAIEQKFEADVAKTSAAALT